MYNYFKMINLHKLTKIFPMKIQSRLLSTENAFSNKTVIITGGSSGIGAEVVQHFAKLGANVVFNGRNTSNLEEVKSKCTADKENSEKVTWFSGDVADASVQNQLINTAVEKYKKIDILVNNAGILIQNPFEKTSMEDYDQIMKTNLRAPVSLTLLALPHLKATKGCIINVSSAASKTPVETFMPYCVAKAGLNMLTTCSAFEMASYGIRVNAIIAGLFETNLLRYSTKKKSERIQKCSDNCISLKRWKYERLPLKRQGNVKEIAEIIAFLCSESAQFITGALVDVDGGTGMRGACVS